jgi:hypothetical protein
MPLSSSITVSMSVLGASFVFEVAPFVVAFFFVEVRLEVRFGAFFFWKRRRDKTFMLYPCGATLIGD